MNATIEKPREQWDEEERRRVLYPFFACGYRGRETSSFFLSGSVNGNREKGANRMKCSGVFPASFGSSYSYTPDVRLGLG